MNLIGVLDKLKWVHEQLTDMTVLSSFSRVESLFSTLKDVAAEAGQFFQEIKDDHLEVKDDPVAARSPKKGKPKKGQATEEEEIKEVEPDKELPQASVQEFRAMKDSFNQLGCRSPGAVGMHRRGKPGGFNPHFEVAMFKVITQLVTEIVSRLENKE